MNTVFLYKIQVYSSIQRFFLFSNGTSRAGWHTIFMRDMLQSYYSLEECVLRESNSYKLSTCSKIYLFFWDELAEKQLQLEEQQNNGTSI